MSKKTNGIHFSYGAKPIPLQCTPFRSKFSLPFFPHHPSVLYQMLQFDLPQRYRWSMMGQNSSSGTLQIEDFLRLMIDYSLNAEHLEKVVAWCPWPQGHLWIDQRSSCLKIRLWSMETHEASNVRPKIILLQNRIVVFLHSAFQLIFSISPSETWIFELPRIIGKWTSRQKSPSRLSLEKGNRHHSLPPARGRNRIRFSDSLPIKDFPGIPPGNLILNSR